MDGVVANRVHGTWRGWGDPKFQLKKILDSGRCCCYQDLHSRVSGGPAVERPGQKGGGRSVREGKRVRSELKG